MPTLIYFADPSNGRLGRGATIRLGSGEPCSVSIARTGVRVKKSRLGWFGPLLYNETNLYKVAQTAEALDRQFPANLLPPGLTDPVLRAFANAIFHCSSSAEVAVILNRATSAALTEAGSTPGSPIVIHAAHSIEGIPREYAALRALFGEAKRNWNLIDRRVINTDDGRTLERFVVSTSGHRKEVYFDITSWMSGNTTRAAKDALDQLVARHDRIVKVLIPKEEFFTLQGVLLRLTEAQLAQLGVSLGERKELLDPLVDTALQWKAYELIPAHVSVSMLVSGWRKIVVLLGSLEPNTLLQEEEYKNLKVIISGTISQARMPPSEQ